MQPLFHWLGNINNEVSRMSDPAYINTKEYLVKKYSSMSQQERDNKRAGFDSLRRFHALTDNPSTVAYYKRLLGFLDESEKEREP